MTSWVRCFLQMEEESIRGMIFNLFVNTIHILRELKFVYYKKEENSGEIRIVGGEEGPSEQNNGLLSIECHYQPAVMLLE